LQRLAETHANTVMLGRTLLQAAPPTTFGLKAAGWLGSVQRSKVRLSAAFGEALVVQFGGATGTLASLGEHGIAVARALAEELQLGLPDAAWHTHRDRLAPRGTRFLSRALYGNYGFGVASARRGG